MKTMKNQKIVLIGAVMATSALLLSQVVLAGPPGDPSGGNLPDANFNKVTVSNTSNAEGAIVTTNNDGFTARLINNFTGASFLTKGALSAIAYHPNGYGVLGYNLGVSAGSGVGVYGYSSQNTGVFGYSGNGRGIFGQAGSTASATGGYFSKTGSTNAATLASSTSALSTNGDVYLNNGVLYAQGSGSNKAASLQKFCAVLVTFSGGGDFSMIATGNPCTIQFVPAYATPAATCADLNGTYTAGNRQCNWVDPGYTPNANFCQVAGSPSPYISSGSCVGIYSSAASINGSTAINGPITNSDASKPVLVSDANGFEVSHKDVADRAIFLKTSSSGGDEAEIGFRDNLDNDGLRISSPRSVILSPNHDDHANQQIIVSDTIFKVSPSTVYAPEMSIIGSDNSNVPLLVEGLQVDSGSSADEDGHKVATSSRGDQIGVLASSWMNGFAPPAGTISPMGGGNAFRSTGLYAIGNTTVNNAGAGIFEILGGTKWAKMAWKDGSGVTWAMQTDGPVEVGGNLSVKSGFSSGGGNLTVTGTASKTGGGSWSVLSDERLKDVHAKFTRGLADLMKIQPVSYNYKKDNAEELPSDKTFIGVIAQEIQKAVPEAVSKDEKGYFKVNNDPIIWTMLNAIKELNLSTSKEIAELRAENAELKVRLDKLEQKLK